MEYIVILATIMAILGILGYLFGTRAALLTAVATWAGLLLLGRNGDGLVKIINGLYFGLRFALAGGLQALGGSGDTGAAINQVMADLGDVEPLISPETTGIGSLIVLCVLVLLSLLLGRTARIKGPSSRMGLVLGLLSGYVLGASLVTALAPGLISLPLPFGLGNNAEAGLTSPGRPVIGLGERLSQLVASTSDSTLAIVAMAAIALFLIVAVRAGNKGKAR